MLKKGYWVKVGKKESMWAERVWQSTRKKNGEEKKKKDMGW